MSKDLRSIKVSAGNGGDKTKLTLSRFFRDRKGTMLQICYGDRFFQLDKKQTRSFIKQLLRIF